MRKILSAVAGACLVLIGSHVGAQAAPHDREIILKIDSETLAGALDQWAAQTGVQLFSPSWEIARKITATPLKGSYTAREALEKLLSGTPLTGEWMNHKAVAIREKSSVPASPATSPKTTAAGQIPPTRFAENQATASADGSGAFAGSAPRDSAIADRDVQSPDDLEEIVVTGTHIRGVKNKTAQVITLDREYIDASGAGSAARLIESLPQNFALSSQSGVIVPGISGSPIQGASINLRGIGEGTTLVLLNGRRTALGFAGSAVDIAALPLSAVERVEVLTDGASAIYGSDAVGGVVNFILRQDFSGAETRLRTGRADGHIEEYRVSQAFGQNWDSGNALASVEYYKRDLLRARERDFVPDDVLVGSLMPRDENYSALIHARQELTDELTLFTDALHIDRSAYHEGGLITASEHFEVDNPQTTATVGLDWDIDPTWRVEASGGYARNKADVTHQNMSEPRGNRFSSNQFDITTARVQADGSTTFFGNRRVGIAAGAEWRREVLDASSRFADGSTSEDVSFDQTVSSAFAELYVPVVRPEDHVRAVNSLELSLAGRFDDYSTFGSSADPRIGLMWAPLHGVRFRGSYGTSYVAPKLTDRTLSTNGAFALTDADPGSLSGFSHQLLVFGSAVERLAPQESKNYTLGLEFEPSSDLVLSLNYYRIEYTGRIADPPFTNVLLANPNSFGDLIIRNPSPGQVADYIRIGELGGLPLQAFNPDFSPNTDFDPNTVEVIVDGRRRNLSVTETSGIDVALRTAFDVSAGTLGLGLDGAYIFELEQQVTASSEAFDTVDTFFNPPDWRLRGNLSWQLRRWTANVFVNYADGYTDNRVPDVFVKVGSYTTVDASLKFNFGSAQSDGLLSGMSIVVSAQNLLDRDPPRTVVVDEFRDLGFDPTNASPLGRFVGVELTKNW